MHTLAEGLPPSGSFGNGKDSPLCLLHGSTDNFGGTQAGHPLHRQVPDQALSGLVDQDDPIFGILEDLGKAILLFQEALGFPLLRGNVGKDHDTDTGLSRPLFEAVGIRHNPPLRAVGAEDSPLFVLHPLPFQKALEEGELLDPAGGSIGTEGVPVDVSKVRKGDALDEFSALAEDLLGGRVGAEDLSLPQRRDHYPRRDLLKQQA